ncbi:MAG: cytidylate kinase family protein [Methanosarcinales archaeon]|jgi:cytidylate kinase|nr:cytidylate kinase family protein [Methanosarcinales archaeon]
MIITISGLPGSGTTSVANALSDLTDYHIISAGQIFRQKAAERELSLEEFSRLVDSDYSIDSELDNQLIKCVGSSDCIILEGRLTGHFILSEKIQKPCGFLRVCLKAPFDVRIARIAKRDNLTKEEAEEFTRIRESNELLRHELNYGVTVETTAYDVIFNTEVLSTVQIADALHTIYSHFPSDYSRGYFA